MGPKVSHWSIVLAKFYRILLLYNSNLIYITYHKKECSVEGGSIFINFLLCLETSMAGRKTRLRMLEWRDFTTRSNTTLRLSIY